MKRAFTLVEVVVALALVGVGLTAVSASLGAITRAYGSLQMADRVHRAAVSVYEEIVSRDEPTGDALDGSLLIDGRTEVIWSAQVETTALADVERLTVTAHPAGRNEPSVVVSGVFCPPDVSITTEMPAP